MGVATLYRGLAFGTFAALYSALPVAAGPAIGQFELKDLEAEPGGVEFQSQNAHILQNPKRKIDASDPDETLFDDNAVQHQRHALELEFGITRYLKTRIGIEYEKERIDDPDSIGAANDFEDLKLSEAGIEAILILKRVPENGFGFGIVTEYERPIESEESSAWVIGPIIQGKFGKVSTNLNLTAVRAIGGEAPSDDKWDFAYAAKLAYDFNENWALALEGYGTVDRIGNSGNPSEDAVRFGDHDQHRLGPILYYTFNAGKDLSLSPVELSGKEGGEGPEVLLGAGVLVGLNDNTPDATLKWTIEVEF